MSLNEKDLYRPFTNKHGKRVSGTASFLHYLKEVGGIKNYNDIIGAEYILAYVKDHSEIIQEGILAQEKKRRFKSVV